MSGLKTRSGKKAVAKSTRDAVLAAVRQPPAGGDFVWDGHDEDDRPASTEELASAVRKRGRPVGSGNKEQVAIRLDRDLLEQLRATGPGWQTRVNEAVRAWLESIASRPGSDSGRDTKSGEGFRFKA